MREEKGIIYDLLSIIPYMLLILALVSLSLFMKSLSDRSHYLSYAEDIIARYGGLTPAAVEILDTYSNEHYNGNFRIYGVESIPSQYGSIIEFSLYGNHDLVFFKIPYEVTSVAQSVSEVRP